jgi:hypothetical protein
MRERAAGRLASALKEMKKAGLGGPPFSRLE